MSTDVITIQLLVPELILILLAAWVFVASAFQPTRIWWTLFSAAVFGLAAIALWRQDVGGTAVLGEDLPQALSGPLLVDAFGYTGRWLAVLLGLLFLPLAALATRAALHGEFLGSAILAFTGLMIVAMAGDIILLILGMELISIPTYVMLFLGRSDRRGAEAAVKYFFLSILASALLLYGLSFLYGAAGSTNLTEIQRNLAAGGDAAGKHFLPLAMILIFAGLGFKAAAVPFHFYAPDVYQATTNANAGLLAVVPKAAALLAIMRLTIAAAPAAGDVSWKIAVVMSIASMTLGNACALWQRDLRRMLAYSSIANAGYMLIGVAAALAAGQAPVGYDGFGATLLSLIVYSVAALGAFATLAYLSDGQRETSQLDQLGGLPKRRPLAAALLTIFMFSLSGIPPLAGFWGKLTLFTSALEQFRETAAAPTWFLVLLIAAALNAAVAAAYYLRVIATMYFGSDETAGAGNGVSQLAGVSAVACGVFVVACGLFPGSLVERTGAAGQSAHSSQTPLVLESARAAERPFRGTY